MGRCWRDDPATPSEGTQRCSSTRPVLRLPRPLISMWPRLPPPGNANPVSGRVRCSQVSTLRRWISLPFRMVLLETRLPGHSARPTGSIFIEQVGLMSSPPKGGRKCQTDVRADECLVDLPDVPTPVGIAGQRVIRYLIRPPGAAASYSPLPSRTDTNRPRAGPPTIDSARTRGYYALVSFPPCQGVKAGAKW